MSRRTLIRGAALLGETTGDVLVADGRIVELGRVESAGDATLVDADGLVLLPGLVDLHTHLREPGLEEAETIESGTAAAATGGYTAVTAMANLTPVTDTADRADWIAERAAATAHTDVAVVGAVTRGLAGLELADLVAMASGPARVRVFSDDGRCVMNAALMREALRLLTPFDAVISQHSQDSSLAPASASCCDGEVAASLGAVGWPAVAEEVIVARDVTLARETGGRVHVAHVSSPATLDVIRWARSRGVRVTAEVTPHHLLLPADLIVGGDPTYKVNPPLRPAADTLALREAVADGTVDVVATDHAPHPARTKALPLEQAAFGMLGLETAFAVVNTLLRAPGLISWARLVDVMSSTPARLAQLPGQGQGLRVGAPANLTLVDPHATQVVDRDLSRSRSRNNPYHGQTLSGVVHGTWLRGRRTYTTGDTPS